MVTHTATKQSVAFQRCKRTLLFSTHENSFDLDSDVGESNR